MSNAESMKYPVRAPRMPRREASPPPPSPSLNVVSQTSRVLLVDFRSGEPVHRHPDLLPLLVDGWMIKSAVPRLVENEGLKLLVVLRRAAPIAS